jgi:hypothetical protein
VTTTREIVPDLPERVTAFDDLLEAFKTCARKGHSVGVEDIAAMMMPVPGVVADITEHCATLAIALAIAMQRLVLG